MGGFSSKHAERYEDKDGRSRAEKLCRRQACAIQNCLASRGYQQEKCQQVIDEYYECVARMEGKVEERKTDGRRKPDPQPTDGKKS
ncbi:unnamed protein product [Vitrella brassicaformis CCMP3155]|uniref:CHCH domain-containing protein n=1 Tax=Vitrella brassicaformis (strain CCMP3155) TaxID=1169540 RepID=A0A0G4EWG6_VITBC|nr:unnamed protein product [Vitrella brassicaformis CCMP3155]|mmetsp:Transcript_20824/g.50783  ORF Transcript_20824/g.50783 Transcript_20824/m.50783 type:complete len:86 (+) Transcript_20824:114-371(+)|eukprot:CEM03302.1 unnamed protein product [Vitrella brassicaformis CCMP3155]